MREITAKTPWKDYMGDVPMHIDYFQGSMFEAVENIAKKYPKNIAFDFVGMPIKSKAICFGYFFAASAKASNRLPSK